MSDEVSILPVERKKTKEEKRPFFPEDASDTDIGFHSGLLSLEP